MTATEQTKSGGDWLSKLVVVLLLALTVGLYLRIVMVDEPRHTDAAAPQASVRVIDGAVPAASTPAAVTRAQDLPQDQINLIKRVFAPELAND
jgi:hypothetical protein